MRIDLNASVGNPGDAGQAGKAAAPAANGGVAAGGDSAKLSNDLAQVQSLTATVLQLPEIRLGKVATLAQQVQGGSYAAEPQQTAEAMLNEITTNLAA